jgi:drug/metabolite transporter (DMT)-like permease
MNFSTHSDRGTAYFFLSLTTAIWGSLYVVTRIVLETVPPVTLLLFRYIIASLALYAFTRTGGKSMRIKPEDRKYFLFIGAVGYFISVGAQVIGTKYAGAAVASLINSMNPVFITLFAVIILREKLTLHKVLAALATLAGAYVILGGAREVGAIWGIAFSLASVLLWSLASVYVRRITQTYDPIIVTKYAIFVATLCSLPASGIELSITTHGELFSLKNILCFLYLGIICTALPYFLWNKSLSLIEASTCSLFYPIQPLVSVLLGIAILNETVDYRFWIGALLIVGGIMYAILSESRGALRREVEEQKAIRNQNKRNE